LALRSINQLNGTPGKNTPAAGCILAEFVEEAKPLIWRTLSWCTATIKGNQVHVSEDGTFNVGGVLFDDYDDINFTKN
jgi:hypothetical protein